jgi:hypothetical protein
MPETDYANKRQYPRRRVFTFCRVVWSSPQASYQVPGMTVDVSKNGLAVLLREPAKPIWMEATIHLMKDLEVRAMPVHKQPWAKRVDGLQVGFAVKQVVSGEREWNAMCNGANGSRPVLPQG